MKNILKYIPGFRSNKKWKMLIAVIYYIFSLVMLVSGIATVLIMLSAPFMVFGVYEYIKFRNSKAAISLLLAGGVFFAATSFGNHNLKTKDNHKNSKVTSAKEDKKSNTNNNDNFANKVVNGQLKISYIDVGQADSILIQQGSSSMLIDAGNNADAQKVKNYISSEGITKLDYVVGTHPHEDHIGGMDYVINSFEIGKIYMPKATSTTKTFKDVVTAIKNKGMKATVPTPGETFKLGDAECTVLGPINSNAGDLNSYSIVLKIVYGNNKFLFTGDAQVSNEQDMINKGYDLSADVLKVGHHGSHTSTCQQFLDKVNPKYAVISVGKDNDYGHPHKETMDRLQAKNITIYRTDESGTIVCTSDGSNIKFSFNK